jgi:hypothetical protein
MRIRFFHGPDREEITVTTGGEVSGPSGAPFHGIAGRGLLPWLQRREAGAALRRRAAYVLEARPDAELDNDALALRAAARRTGTLRFGQSAFAAARQLGDTGGELWAVKEGHTSSVWIASSASESFVVNVARDRAASRELRGSSLRLQALAAARPDLPLAAVLAVESVDLSDVGVTDAVTVTRNTLVESALEIHALPDDGGYGLVERFLSGIPDAPAHIRAIVGRRVSEDQRTCIDTLIAAVRAESVDGAPVQLEVGDGDVVWDGERAVIVAIG